MKILPIVKTSREAIPNQAEIGKPRAKTKALSLREIM